MAGGIFTDRPFEANPKCIIYSIIVIVFYYLIAEKFNPWMTIPIFIVSYVSLAWYDHLYSCNTTMKTGNSPIGLGTLDSIFKPSEGNLLNDQQHAYKKKTYLFHLAVVVPMLLYVGYKGNQTDRRIYPVMLSFGLIAGMYHSGMYLSA